MPWFSHCFATIDNFCNFCLFFLQCLNKTKNQKTKKKTIKTRNQKKMTRPNSLPLPLGCAVLFFFWGVLGFLVAYFLVRCCFFFCNGQQDQKPKKQETRTTRNQKKPKNTKKPNYIYIHHIIYDLFWYLQSEHLEASNLYMPQEIDRAIKCCHLKGFALNYRNFIVYYLFLLDNASLPQEWKCCIHFKNMLQLW